MNGKMKGLIIITIIMIVLGVLVNPIFPIGFGALLLLIVWNSIDAYGGNPHKQRMKRDGRSPLYKSSYRINETNKNVEEKKSGVNSTVFVFCLALAEIIIGFILVLL